MIEVFLESMIFFVALRGILKDKDDEMGKRGKRKKKYKPDYNKEAEALDIMSKDKRKKNKDEDYIPMHKRVENYKLPPAREAQEGHV